MQPLKITGPQLRSARAALGLSVRQVATSTRIGHATIVRYETTDAEISGQPAKLSSLLEFFSREGIEFIGSPDDRPGIRIGHPKQVPD